MNGVRVAALGSYAGTDMPATLRMVFGELGDLPHLPELPDRGAPAQMIGRGCALLDGLAVDLQPSGWRLASGDGSDVRRARSLLRQDLDDLEEQAQGYAGPLKLQVAGPWTLSALVQLAKGAPVLSDHGARREVAASLASGVSSLFTELRRRLPDVQWRLQVDEPMLTAVQTGRVQTASGFGRLRSVGTSELAGAWRGLTAIDPGLVVHSCERHVDLQVLRRAGVRTVAVDVAAARAADHDAWAGWLEDGGTLWAGVVPTDQPRGVTADEVTATTLALVRRWALDPAIVRERLWLTPACGLASWPSSQAVGVSRALTRGAALVDERLGS